MIKQFFFRRLRSYFLTMILPTLLIFLVVGYFFLSSQQEALEKRGEATLGTLGKSIETTFYNSGYQIDAMLNNSSFALSLRKVFKQIPMEQKERYFYEMLKNLFISYEVAYPYMHSLYIYMEGYERFMTSTSGQIANINTYYDMEWLDVYRQMPEEDRMYTYRRWVQRNSYDEPKELITVFYRNSRINAVTVINIDKKEFGELLRAIAFDEHQQVFLLNSRGSVVCATDSSLEDDALGALLPQSNLLGEGAEGSRQLSIGSDAYRIYIQQVKLLDIALVSAIPETYLYSEIGYYLLLGSIVLCMDILFIFFLSYFSTKRSFRFIHECDTMFSTAEQDFAGRMQTGTLVPHDKHEANAADAKDEYELMLRNIRFLYSQSTQMQRELLERHYQYTRAEMKALQMQINPHFIFNTLQIVDIEIIKSKGVACVSHKMIQELSKVVKYAFTNPMEEVTLAEELDYLKSYLEIQAVRYDGQVITCFEVDENLMERKVFRLLLQPMYENCFTHGIRANCRQMVIRLKTFRQGEDICFVLIDNGRGMSKERLAELYEEFESQKPKSIGLANVNRRLVLRYGQASALKITSKENKGTTIRFTIPAFDGMPEAKDKN